VCEKGGFMVVVGRDMCVSCCIKGVCKRGVREKGGFYIVGV
jgi:hypothetical protein